MHHHARPLAHAPNLGLDHALGKPQIGANLIEAVHAVEELEEG